MGKQVAKVLERFYCTGELTVGEAIIPIGFYLSAGSDFRLTFDIAPLTASDYVKAVGSISASGQPVVELLLTGQSENGFTARSESVAVVGHTNGSNGFEIRVEAQAVEITIPLEKPQPTPSLRLWLRSFKSFRNPVIETPLGELGVYGAPRTDNVDEVSGNITLVAPTDADHLEWYDKADNFLEHMHQGLAFAHGGRLQATRLDWCVGNICKTTYYSGSGFRSEFPIQHSLHHGPIIKALVSRYFLKGPLQEHLWTALGWMQVDTTFDEVRFLTGMTALESLLEHVLPASKGTTIPKAEFGPLKSKLEQVIREHEGIDDDACNIFIGKIGGINMKTFAQKIDGLFNHYCISRRDLGPSTIQAMVKLRNDIVHRGEFPKDSDHWENIIRIRELITRIILAEIGFKGRYMCYIGGLHDEEFPVAATTIESSIDR